MEQEQLPLEKTIYINMSNSNWTLLGLGFAIFLILATYIGYSMAETRLANSDCPENTIGVWMLYDDGARYRMCVEKRLEIKKR